MYARGVSPFTAIFIPDELAAAVSDRAWVAGLLAAERALARAQSLAGTLNSRRRGDGREALRRPVRVRCGGARPARPRVGEPGRPARPGTARPGRRGSRTAARRARTSSTRRRCSSRGRRCGSSTPSSAGSPTRARGSRTSTAGRCSRRARSCSRPSRRPSATRRRAWLTGTLDARDRVRGRHGEPAGAARRRRRARSRRFGDAGPEVARLFAAELSCASRPFRGTRCARRSPTSAGALATAAGLPRRSRRTSCCSRRPRWQRSRSRRAADRRRCRTSRTRSRAVARASRASATRGRTAAILFESIVAEHERAAGAWHAEWHALTTALGRRPAARRRRRGARSRGSRSMPSACARTSPGDTLSEAGSFGHRRREPARTSTSARLPRSSTVRCAPTDDA